MKSIFRLNSQCSITHYLHGGKAFGLWQLSKIGVEIPETIIIPLGTEVTFEDINWIGKQLTPHNRFIVRSSAEIEDQYSQSMAGVFQSRISLLNDLSQVIKEIRIHASRWIKDNDNPDISIIVQPYLSGIGGVYLSSLDGQQEYLTLSRYGAAAVTSGVSSSIDQISKNTKEYKLAIKHCRNVQKKLGGAIDLELIIANDDCIFIQYRPYKDSGFLSFSVNNNSESTYRNKISEYFPFPLNPLCGTLWVKHLNEILGANAYYENGFILGLHEDYENIDLDLSESILEEAYSFYKKRLFVSWDRKLKYLKSLYQKKNPIHVWEEVYNAWSLFLNDYFKNSYEPIVSKARSIAPKGSAFSPKVKQRIADHLKARKAFLLLVNKKNWIDLPETKIYLQRYGHQFLSENDFGQPPLLEQPESLLALLEIPISDDFSQQYQYEVTNILKVAWLAEDDNNYKHLFAYQMRLAIHGVAQYLVDVGTLTYVNNIWNLTIDDLECALNGEEIAEKLFPAISPQGSSRSSKIYEGRFTATILSPGSSTGKACISSSVKQGCILVRTVLREIDYPALMSSNGAIVALGSIDSHAAIFARDICKPLYLCPTLVSSLVEDSELSLNEDSMEITVTY